MIQDYIKFGCRILGTDGEYYYLANAPDWGDGCMTMGFTMDEAFTELDFAIEAFMEHSIEHNLPIPDPSPLDGFAFDYGIFYA